MERQEKPSPFVIGSLITVLFFLLLLVFAFFDTWSIKSAINAVLETRGLFVVVLLITTLFAGALTK